MACRRALGEETKPNTLHVAADEESSRYFLGHLLVEGRSMLARRC